MDQLHALARQERNLVVWAGGPAAGHEAAARAFEQRYPGIPVAVTAGFSNVLDRKIEEQIQSGRIEADVLILQTVQDLVRWNNGGHRLRTETRYTREHAKPWLSQGVSRATWYRRERETPSSI